MHKNLKPLEEFICDVCGEIINSPKEGYVIWRSDRDHDRLQYDFKIIHQMICDDRSCGNSMPLKKFLGVDGLSYLLAFYSLGPLKTFPLPNEFRSKNRIFNNDEFIDFIRRVQIPYYEEARQYFNKREVLEDYSDSNEYYPYLPHILKKIIEENQKPHI